ncbi:MAG: hypothetical protein U0359_22015 [Byssovorax sp.]
MISVVPSPVITVSSTTPVHYVLGVYCAEFEKDNPSSDVTFTFGKVDPVLACITETAARFEGRTIQAAVWIKTDFRDVEPALAHKTIDKKYPLSNREGRTRSASRVSCGVLGKEAVNALPEADAAASPASRMPPPLPPGGCCGGPSAAAR